MDWTAWRHFLSRVAEQDRQSAEIWFKVSLENTETRHSSVMKQYCQSAFKEKKKISNQSVIQNEKRESEGYAVNREGKGRSVSHEGDSAEKGICIRLTHRCESASHWSLGPNLFGIHGNNVLLFPVFPHREENKTLARRLVLLHSFPLPKISPFDIQHAHTSSILHFWYFFFLHAVTT